MDRYSIQRTWSHLVEPIRLRMTSCVFIGITDVVDWGTGLESSWVAKLSVFARMGEPSKPSGCDCQLDPGLASHASYLSSRQATSPVRSSLLSDTSILGGSSPFNSRPFEPRG